MEAICSGSYLKHLLPLAAEEITKLVYFCLLALFTSAPGCDFNHIFLSVDKVFKVQSLRFEIKLYFQYCLWLAFFLQKPFNAFTFSYYLSI